MAEKQELIEIRILKKQLQILKAQEQFIKTASPEALQTAIDDGLLS